VGCREAFALPLVVFLRVSSDDLTGSILNVSVNAAAGEMLFDCASGLPV